MLLQKVVVRHTGHSTPNTLKNSRKCKENPYGLCEPDPNLLQNVAHYRRQKGLALDYSTLWWLIAGAFVATELLTGSFYLLMLALGVAAAALAAHAGVALSGQLVTAAAVGLTAVVLWHRRRHRATEHEAHAQTSAMLDIGETVMVNEWNDGCAEVKYRGARWQAVCHGPSPEPGLHQVVALQGNRLILEPVASATTH